MLACVLIVDVCLSQPAAVVDSRMPPHTHAFCLDPCPRPLLCMGIHGTAAGNQLHRPGRLQPGEAAPAAVGGGQGRGRSHCGVHSLVGDCRGAARWASLATVARTACLRASKSMDGRGCMHRHLPICIVQGAQLAVAAVQGDTAAGARLCGCRGRHCVWTQVGCHISPRVTAEVQAQQQYNKHSLGKGAAAVNNVHTGPCHG